MKYLKLSLIPALIASPAAAAEGAFFSLRNADFIVTLAFLLFIGVLFYFKVPSLIIGLLDKRADGIRNDLSEAKALREEAQTLLASYERKHKEVQEQSARIVEAAKEEAATAAELAKADLKAAIVRRLAAAEEQIESAKSAAIKDVRDTAIGVAIAAASDVIAKQMTAADGNSLIEAAISDVEAKLH